MRRIVEKSSTIRILMSRLTFMLMAPHSMTLSFGLCRRLLIRLQRVGGDAVGRSVAILQDVLRGLVIQDHDADATVDRIGGIVAIGGGRRAEAAPAGPVGL